MDDKATEPEIIVVGNPEEQAVPARAADVLPERIYLLPVSTRPFFPAQNLPIVTSDRFWHETVELVGKTPHHLVGLVMASNEEQELPLPHDFAKMGTVVRIHQAARGAEKIQFLAEGLKRFTIERWLSDSPPYLVQVSYPEEHQEDPDQVRAYALSIINTIKELLPLNPLYKEQLRLFLERFNPDEASPLADFAAALTSASATELQDVLATIPLLRRMEKVLILIQKELEVAGMQVRIREKVEERVSEQQRQFFLKEQLKEIQHELGISKDDKTVELEAFKGRLEELEVPEHAQRRIDEEVKKFSFLEPGSPEYAVTRNYLDVVTSLPWGKYSVDQLDLERARAILDRDHDSLSDVKQRIIEFLAVGVLKGEVSGSILLLVGPPGVGKSSIGRSIAAALDRPFYRLSLGGMRDEAEIKGHRRTYIGAMPGKFIHAIKEAGTANPVIMLDEVDKIGASYQGDPGSALLEVLDPELNSDFLDHFLDLRFDLSKTLFVCTANQLDTIPGPLLDRMEIIRLAGYLTTEKVQIGRRHLWPRARSQAGVTAGDVGISNAALRKIIEGYAREAGVRNLEKQMSRILRKTVIQLLDGAERPIRIGVGDIETYLGPPVFRRPRLTNAVGVVTGLAWTPLGGAMLNIEATKVHDASRGFKQTGQLGNVMRESAEIAYSYVASNMQNLGADPAYFATAFVHLHVPAGATPKDGPSAGITMATALLSLARGQKLARALAMTGEITLTGLVLPVGGIREKLLAARRNRVMELILPDANRRDFDELPDYLHEGLNVHFVKHFREVAAIVLPS